MTDRLVITLVALAVGCNRAPPAPSTEADTRRPPSASGDAAAAVVTAPDAGTPTDCTKLLGPLRSKVDSAYSAKEPVGPYEKAIDLWPGVPAECRSGEWYVLGAKLLAWGRRGTRLEASGVVLETRDQALAEAAQLPLGAEDLTYLAMTAAAGGSTKLPADACRIAEAEISGKAAGALLREATDRARYVCAHAALASGDAAGAKARLGAIEDAGFYPDLDLRLAEAELALGNHKEAKRLAKKAASLDQLEASWRFVSTDDWKAIVAAAKAIAE